MRLRNVFLSLSFRGRAVGPLRVAVRGPLARKFVSSSSYRALASSRECPSFRSSRRPVVRAEILLLDSCN